jgi:molecular chaperone DnaK (HSP70)
VIGLEGFKEPKTPTVISYDPNDKKTFVWGALTNRIEKGKKIEAIKLLLDPEVEKPLYVPQSNTKAQIQRLGKPPVEVAGEYISAIYKHALSKIELKMTAEYLQMCQKKFVVTVPAVWSDKAKDTTLKVCSRLNAERTYLTDFQYPRQRSAQVFTQSH